MLGDIEILFTIGTGGSESPANGEMLWAEAVTVFGKRHEPHGTAAS